MKHIKKPVLIVSIILLATPFLGSCQNMDTNDSSILNLKTAASEIMAAAGTCALITLDENNLPMVRAMDPFPPEADFTVWFGTNPKSGKVNQIKNNPTVTLYYLDGDASGYVVIHGKAQVVDEQNEKETHWKVEWEDFYPNKPEDYLLIKVTPEWMEVLSPSRGIDGDPATWKAPVVFFNAKN